MDGAAPNASNRYGDYAGLCVDPADDRGFWFTGEYNRVNNWSTRIGTFKIGSGTPLAVKASSPEARPNIEQRLDALEKQVEKLSDKLKNLAP